jgi:hypothetical protein
VASPASANPAIPRSLTKASAAAIDTEVTMTDRRSILFVVIPNYLLPALQRSKKSQ